MNGIILTCRDQRTSRGRRGGRDKLLGWSLEAAGWIKAEKRRILTNQSAAGFGLAQQSRAYLFHGGRRRVVLGERGVVVHEAGDLGL